MTAPIGIVLFDDVEARDFAVLPERAFADAPAFRPLRSGSFDTSNERIEAARSGDARALEDLLRERRAQVLRYALRFGVSPEDAQDATQEVLLSLARCVGELREVAALSNWLFLAVRTHCMRQARRSLRHAVMLDDGAPLAIEGATPEEQLVDRQLRQRVSVVLREIDPALRDVLLRRDVFGESAIEAAEALGISVAALKSRLHRARGEVKRRLLLSLREPTGKKMKRSRFHDRSGRGGGSVEEE